VYNIFLIKKKAGLASRLFTYLTPPIYLKEKWSYLPEKISEPHISPKEDTEGFPQTPVSTGTEIERAIGVTYPDFNPCSRLPKKGQEEETNPIKPCAQSNENETKMKNFFYHGDCLF